jgi:predicted DsbA family dithiol-disulfide isomerase
MQQIMIEVDENIEKAFKLASQQQKQELSCLVTAYLGSFWEQKNLIEVMEVISDNAEKRGLTPEILAELLADD